MRRLRQALKRPYHIRPCTPTKDNEGNTYPVYGAAQAIDAIVRKASGRLDVAEYGEHITDVLKMQYEGDTPIKRGDGICVYVGAVDEPDYIVTDIKGSLTEDTFLVYVLEATV